MKKLLLALLASSLFITPALAHNHEEKEENHKPDKLIVFKEGTMNLVSTATFSPDTLYIMYAHNFYQSTFPRSSNPVFSLSYSPIKNLQIEALTALRQNPLEYEIGAKYQVLDQLDGAPLSLAVRGAFNNRGNIGGGDLSLSRIFFDDILQIGANYSIQSDATVDGYKGVFQAAGANAILRVWKDWYLFGDAMVPFNQELINKKGIVWSGGIKKKIPHTPHILTLFAGNQNEYTMSGRTISTSSGSIADVLKVGFNFSINISEVSKMPEKLF